MQYAFDRYVGGTLMAEGASISNASSEAEAMEKARKLFAGMARLGEMARTTFVRRVTEQSATPSSKQSRWSSNDYLA